MDHPAPFADLNDHRHIDADRHVLHHELARGIGER